MTERELLTQALVTREAAYAPYSDFRVGAALLAEDGNVYSGCNVENASYSATVCAERTAFATAIAAGARKFKAIAIAGGKGLKADEKTAPCGICRQVMAEFCDEDFTIVLGNETALSCYKLGDLLPLSFALENE